MAASLQRDDDEMTEAHEINVTPFIDVMLVLLIIFMVAAPLSTVDVAVDLPVSNATPQPRPDKPLFLSVQKDLRLSLGNEIVAREGLGAALDQATKGDKNARIFLRADQVVEYGALMEVMNLLRAAGYLKVALVGLESVQPQSVQPQSVQPAPTGPTAQPPSQTPAKSDAAGSRP